MITSKALELSTIHICLYISGLINWYVVYLCEPSSLLFWNTLNILSECSYSRAADIVMSVFMKFCMVNSNLAIEWQSEAGCFSARLQYLHCYHTALNHGYLVSFIGHTLCEMYQVMHRAMAILDWWLLYNISQGAVKIASHLFSTSQPPATLVLLNPEIISVKISLWQLMPWLLSDINKYDTNNGNRY